MSIATLERVDAPASTEWGPWITGSNGSGQRNWFVLRYQDASNHNSRAEYHVNAKGDAIKYTMAGAEKKAYELNREVADAKRRSAYFAKREAEQQAQQDMARQVREVASCGTLNSEMIARWIIGNFTHNDEVEEMRDDFTERLDAVRDERGEVIDELNVALGYAHAADKLIDGVWQGLHRLEAPNAVEFAYGATDLEKVNDLLSPAHEALEEYCSIGMKYGDLPEKREVA